MAIALFSDDDPVTRMIVIYIIPYTRIVGRGNARCSRYRYNSTRRGAVLFLIGHPIRAAPPHMRI